MIWISLILALLALWILLSIVFWGLRSGITPMPTSQKACKRISEILPKLKENDKIYELGSGWGTLAWLLAKRYPDHWVVGYEISPIPFWASRLFFRRSNLIFEKRNFFKENLGDAALIVCYLYPGAMRQLKDKFQKELKPGTQIVSNTFAIPGWEPKQVLEVNDLYKTKIYRYEI